MGDIDSNSFHTADEEDINNERKDETPVAEKELTVKQLPQLDFDVIKKLVRNENHEKSEEKIHLLKTVNDKLEKSDKLQEELKPSFETSGDAFTGKLTAEDVTTLQDIDRPWQEITKIATLSLKDPSLSLKEFDSSDTSCESHLSNECHCKAPDDNSDVEIKSTTISGSWELTIEHENDFPITAKTSETASGIENKLSDIKNDGNKSLNKESTPSKNDSLKISPSGMLEMTTVLDLQKAEPKIGSSGWSSWASSILHTAANSGSNWGTIGDSPTPSGSTWGTNLINTASNSVSRVRSQIGGGLQTVLQKVESSLGAVSPDILATIVGKEDKLSEEAVTNEEENKIIEAIILTEEKLQLEEKFKEIDATNLELPAKKLINSLQEDVSVITEKLPFSHGSTVSTVISTTDSIGSKVILDSLDTLETIGRKTMGIIHEVEPSMKTKKIEKMKISERIREAKKRAVEVNSSTSVMEPTKKINYAMYFEEYKGLFSLEALELLSKNCENKVASILAHSEGVRAKADMETRILTINNICFRDECDDDSSDDSNEDITEVITDRLKTLGNSLLFTRLDEVYTKGEKITVTWKNLQKEYVLRKIIEHHTEAIKLLAEITARAVELYHKVGDLVLLPQKQSSLEITRCLADLTATVTYKINYFAAKFSEYHQYDYEKVGSEHKEMIGEFITNIFSEATNSCSFIQDSFRLLIPVMQFLLATNTIEAS